jgi:hypothetical protein
VNYWNWFPAEAALNPAAQGCNTSSLTLLMLRLEGAVQQAVAYYRVSTERQGRSGLGLEAQQATVERFAALEAFRLAKSFIESGGDDERLQGPWLT